MTAMPAPAPVAADTVKLIPSNPKTKPDVASARPARSRRGEEVDAPRFDDALKRAKTTARDGETSHEANPAQKSAKPQKTPKAGKAKSKEPKPPEQTGEPEAEQAIDPNPEPEAVADADAAAEAPTPEVVDDSVPAAGVPKTDALEVPALAVAPMPAIPVTADPGATGAQSNEKTSVANGPALVAAANALATPVPQQNAEELPQSSVNNTTEESAELTADQAPAIVAAEDQAGNSNGIDGLETDAPPTARTLQPTSQTTPKPAARPEGAAPATSSIHVALGESSVGDEDTQSDDQPAPKDPTKLIEVFDRDGAKPTAPATPHTGAPTDTSDALVAAFKPATTDPVEHAPPPTAPAAHVAREAEFAQANHDRLVTAMRAELMPRGGTMQIRLDPPELGSLQVAVHMLDGVMSVSFQTSNDEATQLLSHSLTQLKHVLESQGVAVDRLHVQQAPRSEQSSSNSNDPDQNQQRHGAHGDENLARQEQQRKEMLRRMWRRLALGSDPLDLVA